MRWALEISYGSSRAHQPAKDCASSALALGSFYFEKHHSFGLVFMGFGFLVLGLFFLLETPELKMHRIDVFKKR